MLYHRLPIGLIVRIRPVFLHLRSVAPYCSPRILWFGYSNSASSMTVSLLNVHCSFYVILHVLWWAHAHSGVILLSTTPRVLFRSACIPPIWSPQLQYHSQMCIAPSMWFYMYYDEQSNIWEWYCHCRRQHQLVTTTTTTTTTRVKSTLCVCRNNFCSDQVARVLYYYAFWMLIEYSWPCTRYFLNLNYFSSTRVPKSGCQSGTTLIPRGQY
jgi:hypothetical protein